MSSNTPPDDDKLISAYHNMVTRVTDTLDQPTTKGITHHIEIAKEKAVELEELTREEAEHISDYLRRDLEDAANFLVTSGQELKNWLRFDLELIEDRFLELFSLTVDHTREELENLAENARQATEWCSGEITGPGSLYCASCDKEITFHKPSYIPACPNCGATLFKRKADEDAENDDVV